MGKKEGNGMPGGAPDEEKLDLSGAIHTRISAQAGALLKKRAKAEGIKPMTLARQLIYRGLGILKG